jgi:hypothetical protein
VRGRLKTGVARSDDRAAARFRPMPTPSSHPADDVLVRLAREDAEHRMRLRREFGLAFGDDELADILQEAYGRATVALRGDDAPTFPDWPRAVAWFWQVCHHTAIDLKRERDGRGATGRASRPTFVPLGEQETLCAADEALEAINAGGGDSERHAAVVEALRELSDEHVRILQWRYRERLETHVIMRLEGLETAKQYEGRHTRALKALGRTLSRLEPGAACGHVRKVLRRRPHALLGAAAGGTRIHIEECTPCRAFERRLRGALAALPLSPAALGAKVILANSAASSPAAPAANTSAGGGGAWHAALTQPKLAAVITAGTLAAGAAGISARSGLDHSPVAVRTKSRGALTRTSHGPLKRGETLAQHLAHDPLLGPALDARRR